MFRKVLTFFNTLKLFWVSVAPISTIFSVFETGAFLWKGIGTMYKFSVWYEEDLLTEAPSRDE